MATKRPGSRKNQGVFPKPVCQREVRRGDPPGVLRRGATPLLLMNTCLSLRRGPADCGNSRKFRMDGHVVALLAMTMLEISLLLSPNGSALVRTLAMTGFENTPQVDRRWKFYCAFWCLFVAIMHSPPAAER
jgi:hypothetical protein